MEYANVLNIADIVGVTLLKRIVDQLKCQYHAPM